VARFALASLAAFVAIALAVSFFASRQLTHRAEVSAQFHAVFVTDNVLRYALEDAKSSSMESPLTGARYQRVNRLVRERILNAPVVRVKVWSRDGLILYSDAHELVGRHFEGEPEPAALAGEPVSEVSNLQDDENVAERSLAARLFSTYVPLYLNGPGGQPDAVVEVYQDYEPIQDQASSFFRGRMLSFGIALVGLYLALLPIVFRAGRALRRQNEQLESQARRLEELLAEEQETVGELRRLNKMQSDFAAVASHELRTPLTAILGYVKTLRRPDFETDAVARAEFLAAIERQAERLFRLITNLLTATQVEHHEDSLDTAPFDFRSLADEIVEAFNDSNGRLQVTVAEGLPEIESDRVMVGEILANLVDNALKYSPDSTPVQIKAAADYGVVRISVRDSGIGVAPDQRERIFDRFYQADQSATRRFGGIGLGLHLVRELAERLGGRVDLDSRPGIGSTFTVTLPVRWPRPAGGNGPGPNPPRSAGGSRPRRPEVPGYRRQRTRTQVRRPHAGHRMNDG